MKTSILKNVVLKSVLMITAAIMPFTFSITAVAQEVDGLESLDAFRVKFIGGDNEALQFNVKYSNKDRSNVKLLVLDETGEALFENNYSKDIDRKLTIPRLTDSEHVIFIVRSAKENAELSYKVKITTRVVDEAIAP